MPEWIVRVAEWSVLLPLWRRITETIWIRIAASSAVGLFWLLIVISIVSSGGGDNGDNGDMVSDQGGSSTQTASASPSPVDSETETPQQTASPTPTPSPKPTPTPAPTPVVLEGFGLTATESVSPPSAISIVTLTHSGSSNFIVRSFQGGDQELLVNEIGGYVGRRPLFGGDPVLFDVDADGTWSITLEPVGLAGSASFSGSGDDVSGLFDPPSAGGWNISHDGVSNFIVYAHCGGGTDLVANEIGPVSGSTVISFDGAACMWEVEADGNWSLSPQ